MRATQAAAPRPISPQSFKNADSIEIVRGQLVTLGAAFDRFGDQALLAVTSTSECVGIAIERGPVGGMFTAEVAPGSRVLARLGGTVTRGARLVSDTDGDVIASTTPGDVSWLLALEAGDDGDEVEALFGRFVIPA